MARQYGEFDRERTRWIDDNRVSCLVGILENYSLWNRRGNRSRRVDLLYLTYCSTSTPRVSFDVRRHGFSTRWNLQEGSRILRRINDILNERDR